jgi:type IV fimbrial biogenesis protein FimT
MKNHQPGFTVVELLVTIAIVGVVAAVATPSFINVVNTNRLAAQSNELLSAIQYARSEAVRTNARVTFCGTDKVDANDDEDCGDGPQSYWVVIGGADDGGQEQLRVFEAKPPVQVSSDFERITFSADGLARDPGTGDLVVGVITVCLPTSRPARNKRQLNIASGSRVSISTPAEDGEGVCQ